MQTGRGSRPGGAAQGFPSVMIAEEGLVRERPGSQRIDGGHQQPLHRQQVRKGNKDLHRRFTSVFVKEFAEGKIMIP